MANVKWTEFPSGTPVGTDLIPFVSDPGGTPENQTVTVGDFLGNLFARDLTFIIDGGGSVIATGAKRAYLRVPFACTITGWTILGDPAGAIVFDVWRDSYASFPPDNSDSLTGSVQPTVAATNAKATGTTLTGWGTAVAAGDILEVTVDSVATMTKATLILHVTVA